MGKLATGAQLQLSASAISGATGLLAELTSVTPIKVSREAVETTHHASTDQEFLAGLVTKRGPFKADINWVPGGTTDLAVDTLAALTTLIYFKMSIPGSSATITYSGQAVLTDWEKGELTVDGKMTASVTLQPSGTVTKA
jgi:hypothetical protein